MPVILYMLGRLDIGGAELRSLQLFRAIRSRHPELAIAVYVNSREPGCLDGDFEALGIPILRGGVGLRGLIAFWRACRQVRPDIVHVNAGRSGGYLAMVGRIAGARKRICHFRSNEENRRSRYSRFKGRLGGLLVRLFATDIVGVCEGARLYTNIPARRWTTLYNGIEAEPAEAALAARPGRRPAAPAALLMLGRIDPEKDCPRAVAILEALDQAGTVTGTTLDFVGPGRAEEPARLAARIARSPAARRIAVHPATDRPLDRLRRADLLLLTSRREGLPGVVLEALSVGTPVVASDILGPREIAAAVEGVALVPLAASEAEWAAAIAGSLARADPAAILASFRRGPFGFRPFVDRIERLWGLAPEQSGH